MLRRHNAAFCIFEIAGFHSPIELTADFTYVRLHGPGGAYQGSYPAETLWAWAERIRGWLLLRETKIQAELDDVIAVNVTGVVQHLVNVRHTLLRIISFVAQR